MKYGCCVSMIASTPDGTGAEWIPALKKGGYDYIELPVVQISALPEKDFKNILAELSSAHLPCVGMNNLLPADNKITGVNANHDAIFRFLDKAIARIEKMGAKKLVFGCLGAKNLTDGFSWEKAFEQTTAFLQKLSCALPSGITAAVEPIRRQDANFINTLDEGARLVKAVDRKNIRLLADFFHMDENGESLEKLIEYGDLLAHIHFATDKSRVLPIQIDERMSNFLIKLKEAGYDDTFTFEAVAENPAAELPCAVRTVRDYMNSL